jgi:hypothetical protein
MNKMPDVRPDQVWADNDPRSVGRTLRVDQIEDGKATCTVLTNRDAADLNDWGTDMRGRTVSIKVSRFKPTSTGYRLIKDAPSE